MDFPRALTEIAEIHKQIAKGEVYRGYRSAPIAASGLVGLAGAWMQPAAALTDPVAFVEYWIVAALVAGLVGISETAYNYIVHDQTSGRRRTRQVIGQFLPGMIAAAVLTATFMRIDLQLVALLPGVWAICFGVGVFSSRPYLPRASAWVATLYLILGSVLLWRVNPGAPLNPWHVGGPFAAGQLLAAGILYWELERRGS